MHQIVAQRATSKKHIEIFLLYSTMPYKKKYNRRRRKKGGLKSLIKREIEKNEDKKVEKKRFLGLIGSTFDLGGRIWSIFGSQSGLASGQDPDEDFYITLFNGTSATGTNQDEVLPSQGTAAIRNYPSNYNISMIGDEIYLESLFLKYRLFKTPTAPVEDNITCRVMCVETYDKLPDTDFDLDMLLEYQHVNYTSGGTAWSGSVLSSVNRQVVKRVFHDRIHIVNDAGMMGGTKFDTIHLRLNRKLIAVNKGKTPSTGLAMVSVEAPDGTISVPNPNTYVHNGLKTLQTPHIYLLCFSDQTDTDPDDTAIQACWTLRYTDM